MTEKEIVHEVAKQLGFGDWKYKRGFGGQNHYFIHKNSILYVSTSYSSERWSIGIYAKVIVPELRHHDELVQGPTTTGDPRTHVGLRVIGKKIDFSTTEEWGEETLEALKLAGSKAREFFNRVVDPKSANEEYNRYFVKGDTFKEGVVQAKACIGLYYRVLAIKFEAKDDSFEEFRQGMSALFGKNNALQRWNKHYEAGDFDSPHTEAGDAPSSPVVPLMQEHPVGAKAAVCGFVCDQKLSADQFAKTFGVAVEKVATDVELGESVVDYRNGFEPLEIDCFDFGSGTLFISSNDVVSDLDFEKASQHGKYVTFRAMDTASMYSVELFIDGKSAATRVDNEDRTMRDGKQLLPDCADGAMELFDIFLVVKDEFDADFWQLKTTHKGTRIKVNRK